MRSSSWESGEVRELDSAGFALLIGDGDASGGWPWHLGCVAVSARQGDRQCNGHMRLDEDRTVVPFGVELPGEASGLEPDVGNRHRRRVAED